MKKFSKSEFISLLIIFLILIGISVPNFIVSLRRSRDQTRRDDMGIMQQILGGYFVEHLSYPLSSDDGRILNCLKPGEKPVKDSKGIWIYDLIPCAWGTETFKNLLTDRVYLDLLPRDPDYQNGASYLYISDGERYQVYAAMEGMDEAEIDPKIVARGLPCGNKTCNIGRSYNIPTDISIEEYVKTLPVK